MVGLKLVSSAKCFGGFQKVFSHDRILKQVKLLKVNNKKLIVSKELQCQMKFAIYLPPQAELSKVPVLYWLSGLTCTEQNFITKSGFQRYAAEHGLSVVAPDTSPRGCNIEGEDDSYDFGSGAGFYLDATQEKWKTNYRMYTYVTNELPALINSNFNVLPEKKSIFGHSMGGHGALICALKNPGMYKSVSAFAPICNPVNCPWGQKAFSGYLGEDKEKWNDYDACFLVKKYNGPPLEIFIDQGKDDNFFKEGQLLPDNFVAACADNKMQVVLRMQEGYDHSYYFIATFQDEHIKYHAKFLKN